MTLRLLCGFDRAHVARDGSVQREQVRCRIWLNADEVDAFVAEQRGGLPVPPHTGKTKKVSWPDFFVGPEPKG